MQLFIEKMLIENFKGTKHQEITFGKNTAISARNGLGKTTIADAFYWVLFNKDSAGNAPGSDNFREKPLDNSGEEIHNLETNVVLYCKLDDAPFVLRRMQKENWVKKRGSSNPVFQGNVSTYWINDVETGATEFKKRICAIADEDTFPMIATMSAFNAADWKKRRAILLSMSGADVDAALWAQDEYQDLADECNSRGVHVDDIRKVLQDQLRGLKRDAEMIPVRIDEASRSIPDITDAEIKEAEYMVQEQGETIAKLDQLLAAERAGIMENDDSFARLMSVNQQMLAIKDNSLRMRGIEKERIAKEIKMREDTAIALSGRQESIRADIERTKKNWNDALNARDKLRAEYSAVYAQQFQEGEIAENCPTCGQRLPEDQIASAKEKAKLAWSAARKLKLEEIKKAGSDAAERVKKEEDYITQLDSMFEEAESRAQEGGLILASLREEMSELEKKPLSYLTDPNYLELEAQAKALNNGQKETAEDRIRKIESDKEIANRSYTKYKAVLDRRDIGIAAQERVEKLKEEHKAVGARIADVEKKIILAEKFITDRCGMLEENINNLFPVIRWKLFNTQINGGITDTCVCLIPCREGAIPYASANTASKLYADIEVINVLSKFYDAQLPIFFDNRERVNFVPRTESQIITLCVSDDEEMRVEIN